MMKGYTLLLIILISYPVLNAWGEPTDFSLRTGIETRYFNQSPRLNSQLNSSQLSFFIEPEVSWRSDDRNYRFNFIGFGRIDNQDSERTHLDIRELHWSFSDGNWSTLIGINKVFWGVTESVHLVDTINQTDLVENIDQEEKLGQPMIRVGYQADWGLIQLYYLPYFRERNFPGPKGRFGFGLPINDTTPLYESNDKQRHIDLALRYSHYIGDIDVGLHIFSGTNREPRFISQNISTQLNPFYEQMVQFGIDLQYTREAWLWKLETIHRNTETDDFWAAVGGFEYTLFQVFNSNADLGLLMEYQHDDRNRLSGPTIANNDIFLAARYALNDSQDTSVLAGIAIDMDNHTQFINIEAERRFGENLSAELRLRSFNNVDPTDIIATFEKDDHVQLSLNWFF